MVCNNSKVCEMCSNVYIGFKNHCIVSHNIDGSCIKVADLDVSINGNTGVEFNGLSSK